MKLKKDTSVLNYGDTSFRRKRYMNEYRTLLSLLREYMKDNKVWTKNNGIQSGYYTKVIDSTDLFERTENTQDKMAKRGRTLTNSLVKTGLINDERKTSPVGEAWLSNKLNSRDALESILDLSEDNLVFLRQWSKTRLYNVEGNHYFVPFLFILKFLSRYNRVPKNDLLIILHSISPNLKDDQLDKLIENYEEVTTNKITFNEFFSRYLDNVESKENAKKVADLLSSDNISQDEFNLFFVNGKSMEKAGPVYLEFIKEVLKFRANPTYNTMKNLITRGKNSQIKKAFGFNKHPFIFSKGRNFTVQEFIEKNSDSPLINNKFSLEEIYRLFRSSKQADLISEYGDMTIRLTNLSGIISYENNVASLPLKPIFERIFDEFPIKLTGNQLYINYEQNLDSMFYKDITFLEILELSDDQINNLLNEVARDLELSDPADIADKVEKENDKRFVELIERKFPKNVVIKLLQQFINREDSKISQTVTDNAPIADIFEYVLGLAWYHISGGKVNVRKAYKMSLDADFLPLSHAAGYQGDLEFDYGVSTLLLEATLMDRSTQKRGELEPVIRHTTNLAVENNDKPMQTIFVASELDDNVMNIFRATQFIELNHSSCPGSVVGINIFALNISELIQLLNADISDIRILNSINNKREQKPKTIHNGWREEIVKEILSGEYISSDKLEIKIDE